MQRAGVVARAPHTRPHTCPHTRAHTCPHMRPRTRPHTRSSHAVLTPSSHAPSHAPSHASSPLTRVLTRAFARDHSAPGVRPAGSATTGAVHTSLYSNGVFLAANSVSDERDVLVGMAPDPAEILRVRRPPAGAQAIARSTLTRDIWRWPGVCRWFMRAAMCWWRWRPTASSRGARGRSRSGPRPSRPLRTVLPAKKRSKLSRHRGSPKGRGGRP